LSGFVARTSSRTEVTVGRVLPLDLPVSRRRVAFFAPPSKEGERKTMKKVEKTMEERLRQNRES
jgi:hypothetical protein